MARTLALLLFAAVATDASAERPKVVKAEPDNAAQEVDPDVKELRIVFDQPMSLGGWSVVGSGPLFPQFIGKPRWENDRTFVLGWRLEAEHDYRLSINSARFTNFRSAAREPAVPYPITFRTGKTKSDPKQSRMNWNREALQHLRRAIDEDYSYRDLRQVNWEERFKEFAPRLEAAGSAREFAQVAAELLSTARDIHLNFKVEGETIPTHRRRVPWNVAVSALPQRVPGWKQHNPTVASGKFEDGTRYLFLRDWPADQPLRLEPAYEMLAEAADANRPLIIDVRGNSGGDEALAQQFAGCFVEKDAPYAKHVLRRNGWFSDAFERVLKPNRARPKFRGRVAVLIGQGTVSSCESFVLMMKQSPGGVLIGEETGGASGNPRPVDLGNGVTALVPSWKDLRLDGTCFEGEGIAPDIRVKTTVEELARRDPVLAAALEHLRGQR